MHCIQYKKEEKRSFFIDKNRYSFYSFGLIVKKESVEEYNLQIILEIKRRCPHLLLSFG